MHGPSFVDTHTCELHLVFIFIFKPLSLFIDFYSNFLGFPLFYFAINTRRKIFIELAE